MTLQSIHCTVEKPFRNTSVREPTNISFSLIEQFCTIKATMRTKRTDVICRYTFQTSHHICYVIYDISDVDMKEAL